MNVYYTLGTLLVGTAFLVWEIADWWPGIKPFRSEKKDWVKLVGPLLPFFLSWCVGALITLCVGGFAATVSEVVIWGTGWLGDAAYVWGVGGTRQSAPVSSDVALTSGGLFMTCLVIAVFLARRKKGEVASKRRGILSGMTMSLSAGVARFVAIPLASTVNLAGAWVTGVVS